MSQKIFVRKQLGALKPVDHVGVDALYKLKEGVIYACQITKPRSSKFHRMFFAMIGLCYENQDIYNSMDNFREEITKAAGHFTSYTNHKGNTVYKAESISFSKMGQDDFEKVYESVFMTCVHIFKWEDVESEFRKELNELRL